MHRFTECLKRVIITDNDRTYVKIVRGKQCIVYWCHELQPKEKVVPHVVEKILLQEKRCSMIGQSDTNIAFWDERLWTFSSKSFVAHGNALHDQNPQDHPVWITSSNTNQNHAQYAVVTGMLSEVCVSSLNFASWVWILNLEEQDAFAQACALRASTSWEDSWIWKYLNKTWEKSSWI